MGFFNNVIFQVGVILILLLAGPFAFIWGVNTLISAAMVGAPTTAFIPQIAFNFWTWLAAVFVGGFALIPKARRGG
jgi:heme/copper-type cytochrome/quinol oxidase subunit 1